MKHLFLFKWKKISNNSRMVHVRTEMKMARKLLGGLRAGSWPDGSGGDWGRKLKYLIWQHVTRVSLPSNTVSAHRLHNGSARSPVTRAFMTSKQQETEAIKAARPEEPRPSSLAHHSNALGWLSTRRFPRFGRENLTRQSLQIGSKWFLLRASARDLCFKTATTSTAAREHQLHLWCRTRPRAPASPSGAVVRPRSDVRRLLVKSWFLALHSAPHIEFYFEKKCLVHIKVGTSCLAWLRLHRPPWRRPLGVLSSTLPSTTDPQHLQTQAQKQALTSPPSSKLDLDWH